MKELIERASDREIELREQISFGMNKAEHLWEAACAQVLGSELNKKLADCRLAWELGGSFRDYMPRPTWSKVGTKDSLSKDGEAYNEKSGWKLDFIRTWPPNRPVEKLVILDAKYYDVSWNKAETVIYSQPGIGDIAKQVFYQMAFADLATENKKADGAPLGFVNAFLFPEDDQELKDNKGNFIIRASESVYLGWDGERALAFLGVNLFAVRLPGIELLRRYASGESGDDWFKGIVALASPRVSAPPSSPC